MPNPIHFTEPAEAVGAVSGRAPELHEIVRVACHVVCDRRTVVSYFAGRRVSSTIRARIEDALRTLGLERLRVQTPVVLTHAD